MGRGGEGGSWRAALPHGQQGARQPRVTSSHCQPTRLLWRQGEEGGVEQLGPLHKAAKALGCGALARPPAVHIPPSRRHLRRVIRAPFLIARATCLLAHTLAGAANGTIHVHSRYALWQRLHGTQLTTRHASPLEPSSGPRHTEVRSRHTNRGWLAGSSAACTSCGIQGRGSAARAQQGRRASEQARGGGGGTGMAASEPPAAAEGSASCLGSLSGREERGH